MYGPPLVSAYKLEPKVAVPPRVVLSEAGAAYAHHNAGARQLVSLGRLPRASGRR